tara:strand:+ start:1221 stop:1412 length:192 start_codon:yes stop_codon:yes gene_type:complete
MEEMICLDGVDCFGTITDVFDVKCVDPEDDFHLSPMIQLNTWEEVLDSARMIAESTVVEITSC